MKKIMFLIAVVTLLFIAGCGSSEKNEESQAEEFTITISNSLEEDSALHLGLVKFKEVAEEKSDGAIKVEVFSNGELYDSEREAIEAVQAGNIEMVSPATAPLAGFNEKFMVMDLLFLFDNEEQAREALDGDLGDKLFESLPENNLKGLGWGQAGMRQITNSERPIHTPEDLEDLKIRVMENSVHIDSFTELGANAQPFAMGELYSALQQNVFDGLENPYNIIESSQLYETQEYLTVSNHVYTPEVLLINNDFYESMPENLQTVLDEAGEEFTTYEREKAIEFDEAALEILEENLEINELSENEKEEFIKLLEPVYDKYEDAIGPELIEIAESYSSN